MGAGLAALGAAVRMKTTGLLPSHCGFEKVGASMKRTEDVRKYAAEQGIAEEEALKKGMEEKSKEFVEKGAEVYAKV